MTINSEENYSAYPQASPKVISWVVVESGLRGTENQCIGLAEAVNCTYERKRIQLNSPWKQLAPYLSIVSLATALSVTSDSMVPPWPDLVISGGRKAAAVAVHIKKASAGKTKLVHIMDPRGRRNKFDLIITPQHDGLSGANVLQTKGALHHVTNGKLTAAHMQFSELYQYLPAPRLGVLIGGNSKSYTMTAEITTRLTARLKALAESGYGVMVTASRRTGEKNNAILKEGLDHPNIQFWDGSGQNPYFGILAWADALLVTEDSVSMTSEALATGKPVEIIGLEKGKASGRFQSFHNSLQQGGYTKEFTGSPDLSRSPPQMDDMRLACQRIFELFA